MKIIETTKKEEELLDKVMEQYRELILIKSLLLYSPDIVDNKKIIEGICGTKIPKKHWKTEKRKIK